MSGEFFKVFSSATKFSHVRLFCSSCKRLSNLETLSATEGRIPSWVESFSFQQPSCPTLNFSFFLLRTLFRFSLTHFQSTFCWSRSFDDAVSRWRTGLGAGVVLADVSCTWILLGVNLLSTRNGAGIPMVSRSAAKREIVVNHWWSFTSDRKGFGWTRLGHTLRYYTSVYKMIQEETWTFRLDYFREEIFAWVLC